MEQKFSGVLPVTVIFNDNSAAIISSVINDRHKDFDKPTYTSKTSGWGPFKKTEQVTTGYEEKDATTFRDQEGRFQWTFDGHHAAAFMAAAIEAQGSGTRTVVMKKDESALGNSWSFTALKAA